MSDSELAGKGFDELRLMLAIYYKDRKDEEIFWLKCSGILKSDDIVKSLKSGDAAKLREEREKRLWRLKKNSNS